MGDISIDKFIKNFKLINDEEGKENKTMKEAKSNVEITCSNVGIKAGSWQCDFCVLKNKCSALKLVKSKNSLEILLLMIQRMEKKNVFIWDSFSNSSNVSYIRHIHNYCCKATTKR